MVLYCGFEVEGLDEGGLVEEVRVAYAAHVDAFRRQAHRELRVLLDPPLDNVRDVFQRLSILAQLIEAKGDVIAF